MKNLDLNIHISTKQIIDLNKTVFWVLAPFSQVDVSEILAASVIQASET